jgi:exosome complex component MTR3
VLIIASILLCRYGPRESKKAQAFSDIGRLNCDVKFASFSTSVRGKASQGIEEKEYTGMLHKALECAVALHTFPKTTVDVFALILQSGGGMELFLPHLYFLLDQIYL